MIALGLLIAKNLVSSEEYHGFLRTEFKQGEFNATLIAPAKAAKGRPWIWRMGPLEAAPELNVLLLRNGFHLAHLDQPEEYGSPGAIGKFDQFYKRLIADQKLNPKVVLDGSGLAGLSAYNWASANPDKVMAIYANDPVCDFRSWPGKREVSREEWEQLIKAYGFPTERHAREYAFGPLGKLAGLAKARVPMIHMVSSVNEKVPAEENSQKMEKAYRALGGTIQVGHNPDLGEVVKFVLAHQNDSRRSPFATVIPSPNPESRYSSAGWQSSWLQQHEDAKQAARDTQPRLVMLGDSITQSWGGPGRKVYNANPDAYKKYLEPFKPVVMGMSGDRTQHVLWRLENGALDGCKPEAVSILIGVGNTNADSPEAIVKGIDEIVKKVKQKQPSAIVILHAMFPVGTQPSDPRRAIASEVNRGLKRLAQRQKTEFLDMTPDFLLPDGSANPAAMSQDGVHLVPGGYELWGRRLNEVLRRTLGAR